MAGVGRLLLVLVLACGSTAGAPLGLMGAEHLGATVDPEISGPAWSEPGAWRTKVQQVFDPATRTLSRRMYTISDLEPSRDLDFVWSPDRASADKPGKITGKGHLVWRIKGRPTYDPSSVSAEYRGSLRNGLIEGHGTYLDHHGLWYEGEWKTGRMHGHGTLKLPGGDEYVGHFRAGKANGAGRYVDVTGEIYEGPFIDGRRQGTGRTTLPNGRSYESRWINGHEIETSRFIRLAQGPGVPLPGGADDIRIGITVERKLRPVPKYKPRIDRGDLIYEVARTASGLSIQPDNSRLIEVWRESKNIQLTTDEEERFGEDHEYGVLSLNKQQLVPLTLMLDIQNRSASRAQVSGLYLDVEKSESDLKPAIQVSVGPFINCNNIPDFKPKLQLQNFGWGTAEQPTLRMVLEPSENRNTDPYVIIKNPEPIKGSTVVDLTPDLYSAGVDTKFLSDATKDMGFACRSTSMQSCFEGLRSSGKFGMLAPFISLQGTSIVIKATSSLQYRWIDGHKNENTAQSKFLITVPLGFLKQQLECGEGGQRQIITTVAQQLKNDAEGYRLPVSYQTSIEAGETGRFSPPDQSGQILSAQIHCSA
jgi:hypothetical protein